MKRQIGSGEKGLPAFLVPGIFSLLAQEAISRGGLLEALAWVMGSPQLALANLALIYSVMMLLSALIGRMAPGALLALMALVLFALVNHGKLIRLHQPLFPWDFWCYKHVLALFPALSKPEISTSSLAPVPAAVLVFLWMLLRRGSPLTMRKRILALLMASATVFSIVHYRTLPWDIPSLLATENEVWDQRWNYERNGFLLAFAMNAHPALVDEPETYCEETIYELLKDAISEKYEAFLTRSEEPVSLVLFVSESFYDLMHIAYEAEEDPLRHFNDLRTRFPSFRMISPSFGGNTSHVEFEMLTGLGNAFLPPGAAPYDHYIKRETPSIAGILKESGYRTIAIHPYHEWFWNRRNAFPLMGLEEFVSLREFNGARQRGWFISDEALVDRIIDTIEGIAGDPFFLYTLSMQNHGEYDANRYAQDEVELRADLPVRLLPMLRTYATSLRDADRELTRLLHYMESRPETILALFCGDHLPSFGPEYALYREAGAIQSDPGDYTRED
ncbi:MAG: LTA synthase family protein, partial [Deltaproteobacteria bacterium]|nr:LTA synthase family protein [Deltaproteobacteria bacterium]